MHLTVLISTVAPISGGEFGSIGAGITLMLVGMFVVFATLLMIMLVIAGINRLVGKEEPATPTGTTATSSPQTPSNANAHSGQLPEKGDDLTPELVAVITAAAVAALQKPVRLRGVTLIDTTGSAWLSGGRSRLMGSHSPTRQHHNK